MLITVVSDFINSLPQHIVSYPIEMLSNHGHASVPIVSDLSLSLLPSALETCLDSIGSMRTTAVAHEFSGIYPVGGTSTASLRLQTGCGEALSRGTAAVYTLQSCHS